MNMKLREIFAYISLPAMVALGVFVHALGREPFSLEMVTFTLLGGFLYFFRPPIGSGL